MLRRIWPLLLAGGAVVMVLAGCGSSSVPPGAVRPAHFLVGAVTDDCASWGRAPV